MQNEKDLNHRTIDEAQAFFLSPDDKDILKDFQDTKYFITLRRVVEDYVLKLNANLLTGSEIEPGTAMDELYALRGFVRYWRKVVSAIENKKDNEKNS